MARSVQINFISYTFFTFLLFGSTFAHAQKVESRLKIIGSEVKGLLDDTAEAFNQEKAKVINELDKARLEAELRLTGIVAEAHERAKRMVEDHEVKAFANKVQELSKIKERTSVNPTDGKASYDLMVGIGFIHDNFRTEIWGKLDPQTRDQLESIVAYVKDAKKPNGKNRYSSEKLDKVVSSLEKILKRHLDEARAEAEQALRSLGNLRQELVACGSDLLVEIKGIGFETKSRLGEIVNEVRPQYIQLTERTKGLPENVENQSIKVLDGLIDQVRQIREKIRPAKN